MAACRFHLQPGRSHARELSYIAIIIIIINYYCHMTRKSVPLRTARLASCGTRTCALEPNFSLVAC